MTPQQSPTDTSVRREQYLAAELDYVVANFPILSPRFRKRLRRIAALTLPSLIAMAENPQNPQQTVFEKLADLMILATLDEWPNVSVEQIGQFTSWYFDTVQQLNLSESDFQLLLKA